MPLTTDDELENSPVVANSLMNRERRLRSYDRELGIDIVNVLGAARTRPARWLDLCCGTANALSEAAALLGDDVEIVGVDLVGFFACPPNPPRLHLVTASVTAWRPGTRFDLITCVHGLHYVGDKLGLLARIGDWLTDDGLFVANGRIRRTGRASITLPYRYLGADDQAGPNYTGQPAVHSHYARA
ncbi:class I SAM-dependent methyltransferase [Nonomuraea sp. 3N208]|uniref:class I SAM-dependent methyltransferase n=1 Tax=Nonomuraea sp. 3N208 TaxID=3457421 RepID=UPI003FD427FE